MYQVIFSIADLGEKVKASYKIIVSIIVSNHSQRSTLKASRQGGGIDWKGEKLKIDQRNELRKLIEKDKSKE